MKNMLMVLITLLILSSCKEKVVKNIDGVKVVIKYEKEKEPFRLRSDKKSGDEFYLDKLDNQGREFPIRRAHQAVYFKDKFWVIGGHDGNKSQNHKYLNDIWSSDDAKVWEQEFAEGKIFSGRSNHQVIVFQGKMWLIGGQLNNADIVYNDIWNTPDGKNWKRVEKQGDIFPGTTHHRVLEFKNELWLIGGYTTEGRTNKIWKSKNGIEWEKVTPKGDVFPAIIKHEIVEFKNKIWLIGGSEENKINNDIWTTSDGVNWDKVEPSGKVFAPRSSHQVIVFGNKLRVIRGVGNEGMLMDLWESEDGIHWKESNITSNSALDIITANSAEHQIVLHNDIIYIIGGVNHWQDFNEVWTLKQISVH